MRGRKKREDCRGRVLGDHSGGERWEEPGCTGKRSGEKE